MPYANAQAKKDYDFQYRRRSLEITHAKDFVYSLKANYGLELDDYLEALLAQAGRCSCCQVYMTYGDRAATQCCVDHCHGKNLFRSLLCSYCNKALGFIETTRFSIYRDYLLKNNSPICPLLSV